MNGFMFSVPTMKQGTFAAPALTQIIARPCSGVCAPEKDKKANSKWHIVHASAADGRSENMRRASRVRQAVTAMAMPSTQRNTFLNSSRRARKIYNCYVFGSMRCASGARRCRRLSAVVPNKSDIMSIINKIYWCRYLKLCVSHSVRRRRRLAVVVCACRKHSFVSFARVSRDINACVQLKSRQKLRKNGIGERASDRVGARRARAVRRKIAVICIDIVTFISIGINDDTQHATPSAGACTHYTWLLQIMNIILVWCGRRRRHENRCARKAVKRTEVNGCALRSAMLENVMDFVFMRGAF